MGLLQGEHPENAEIGVVWLSAYKSCNISETRQDRTKVTIEVE